MLANRLRSPHLQVPTTIENDSTHKHPHKLCLENVFSGPTMSDVEEDKRGFAEKKAKSKRVAPMVKGLAQGHPHCDPFLGQEPRLDAGRSLFCHTEIKRNLEPLTCTGKTQSI